jgi:hypothetical protein
MGFGSILVAAEVLERSMKVNGDLAARPGGPKRVPEAHLDLDPS